MIKVRHIFVNGQMEESVFNNQIELDAHKIDQPGYYEPNCTTEATDTTQEDQQKAVNALSLKYLADTDWYVIRKMETNVEVPAEVLSQRSSARLLIVK